MTINLLIQYTISTTLLMLHTLLTRYSLCRSVAAVTTSALLASMAIAVALLTALDIQDWRLGLELAVAIPLTLAPPHTYLTFKVIRQLNETEQALIQLATVDDLTGCLNRRHFLEMAQAIMQQSRRYDFPIVLLMIDIDRFKRINDQYGHDAGDRILQAFGQTLAQLKRESDVVGRIGGEEFAMLLPHTDLEGGKQAGERIRQALHRLSLPINHGSVSVTVSIGEACLTRDDNLSTLLRKADQAMYRAKQGGRDRLSA